VKKTEHSKGEIREKDRKEKRERKVRNLPEVHARTRWSNLALRPP